MTTLALNGYIFIRTDNIQMTFYSAVNDICDILIETISDTIMQSKRTTAMDFYTNDDLGCY